MIASRERTFTDEVLDDRLAAILRTKTPAQRLAMAFGMWRLARQMIRAGLVAEHSDWSEAQITREVARRMSHGAV
jgi:pyruvoyl-dependent arginine decarboxylase (PvlArgDC)